MPEMLAYNGDDDKEQGGSVMAGSVIGAQLYTLRDYTQTPGDIAETLRKVREMGYEAVQLSALGPIDPRELKKILDGEGLTVAATHSAFETMQDEPQAVIDEHCILECKHAAIGGMPGKYRSEEGFHRFAADASAVAQKLAEGGLIFSYHNHSFELEKFSGRTGLEILIEESDPEYVNFEIDTYWIQHGGGNPVDWIKKVSGRIPVIHLKDMGISNGKQLMAEVGEGNLNWPAIIEACRQAQTEWYLVEQDVCQRDPFDSMAISLRNLKNLGLQ